MPHLLFHTQALVVGSQNVGEADKILALLVPSRGLVEARARSIREQKSKLRYHVQLYDYVTVSLVPGRRSTRLVAARREVEAEALALQPAALVVWSRALGLVRRLVHGETPLVTLFDTLVAALRFLGRQPLAPEALAAAEALLVLQIFNVLGYIEPRPEYAALVTGREWSEALLAEVAPVRPTIIRAINQALQASQL